MRPHLAPLLATLMALAIAATPARAERADTDPARADAATPATSRPADDAAAPMPAPQPVSMTDTHRESRWPLLAFSMSAAADWTSTGWALSHPEARENNPTIAWAKSPAGTIAAGVCIDALGTYAWMRATRRHPSMRAAGFFVAAAFRGYLVVHNIRNNGDRVSALRRN